MNEFDIKAAGWDDNPMHIKRSEAIAAEILKSIPLEPSWRALEYGAGTGITSFLLRNHLKEIIMMDSSPEMVKVMDRKTKEQKVDNLKPFLHDLAENEWDGEKFNLIFTQMTLHHVENIGLLLERFRNLLINGGYLAVADLYPEDGSFHGNAFTGHKGFDPAKLSLTLEKKGFENINYKPCFTIYKKISDKETRQYDLFIMTAAAKKNKAENIINQ